MLGHNGVCFFSTSKSALNMKCFWHFDFQTCSRRSRVHFLTLTSQLPKWLRAAGALYTLTAACAYNSGMHWFNRRFQKWLEAEVLLKLWLGDVLRDLRATPASTFFGNSTSQIEVFFVHLNSTTCFAPQRRAMFANIGRQSASRLF